MFNCRHHFHTGIRPFINYSRQTVMKHLGQIAYQLVLLQIRVLMVKHDPNENMQLLKFTFLQVLCGGMCMASLSTQAQQQFIRLQGEDR